MAASPTDMVSLLDSDVVSAPNSGQRIYRQRQIVQRLPGGRLPPKLPLFAVLESTIDVQAAGETTSP